MTATKPAGYTVTVDVPSVPFGPLGVPPHEADSAYYRNAARNIRSAWSRGTEFACSNLTETVARLCEAAAEAIEKDNA